MPDISVSVNPAHTHFPKSKVRLLGSAPNIEAIEKLIRKFWVSDDWTVDPTTLAISHPNRSTPKSCRVIHKGRRFRFEMIVEDTDSN